MIARSDLDRLLQLDSGPKVSIYMPRHIGSRETRQDPTRLKNLLNTAESKLADIGVRPGQAERLLGDARALLENEAFWRGQSHGLVLFISNDGTQYFDLPAEPAESVCAGSAFHLLPVIAILERERRFLVLTLSRDRALLYRASGEALEPAEVRLPAGVESVIARTDYDGGAAPEDYRKVEIIEYLRQVSKAVEDYAKRERLPIVLVALAENQGQFRALGSHPDLLYLGVDENPDALSGEQLYARALDTLAPMRSQAEAQLVERFGSMLGGNRASTEIAEIAEAAQSGRVDTLILSDKCEQQLEDKLLDAALAFTLKNGGQARILPQSKMPSQVPAAAIFRY